MGFLSKKPSLINLFFAILIFAIQSTQLDAFFLFVDQQNPTVDVVLREVNEYLSRGLKIKAGDENGVSGQFLKRLGFDILISTSRQVTSGLVESIEVSLLYQLINRVYDKKLDDPEFVVLLGISTLFTNDLAGLVAAKKDFARSYLSHMVMQRREVLTDLTKTLDAIPDDKIDNEYAASYRTFLIFYPGKLHLQISDLIGSGTTELSKINWDYDQTDKKKVLEIKAYLQAFGYEVDKKSDFLLSEPFVTFNYWRLMAAFKWLETQKNTDGSLNAEKILSKLTSLQLFRVKENASFSKLIIIDPEKSTARPWTGNFDHDKILSEIRNLDLTDPTSASFKLNELQERLLKIVCANISLTNDQRNEIATEMLKRIYEFKSSAGTILDFGTPLAGKQILASRQATINAAQSQHDSLMAIVKKQRGASGQALLKQQELDIAKLQESHQALVLELRNGALETNSDKIAEIAFLIVNINYWIDVFRRVATELLMDNLKFAFEAKLGKFWQFWRDPKLPLPAGRRTPQEDLFFQKRANSLLLLSSVAQFENILAQQNKKLSAILNGFHAQDLMSFVSSGNPDFVINELWAVFASLSDQTLNDFIDKDFQASRDQNKDKLDKIVEFFRGEVGDADLANSLNFLFVFNQTAGQKVINADMVSEIALRIKNSRRLCQEHIITLQNVAQQKKAVFKSVSQGARSGLIGQENTDQNIYYDEDGRRLVVNESYGGKAMLEGLSEQANKNALAKSKEAQKYENSSKTRMLTAIGAPMIGAIAAGITTGMVASGPAAAIAIPVTIGVGSAVVGAAVGGQALYDAHKGARASAESNKFSGISGNLNKASAVDEEEDSGDEGTLDGDQEADELVDEGNDPIIPSSLPQYDPSFADRRAPKAFLDPQSSTSGPVVSSRPQAQPRGQEASFEPQSALSRRSAFVVPQTSSLPSRIQRAPQSLSSQRQSSGQTSSEFNPLLYERPFER